MSEDEILSKGKDRRKTKARSLLCYWATEYLEISQIELAKLLKLSQPAVSQAVYRGNAIAKAESYSM